MPSVWGGARAATCFPNHCFCEAIRDQLVRQPANALSAAAFIGAGVLILLAPAAPLSVTFRGLYAAVTAVIGVAAIFYHASLTFLGQTADVLGMYLIVTLVLADQLTRSRVLRPLRMVMGYVLANSVLLGALIVWPEARRYVFAALVACVVIGEAAARRRPAMRAPSRYFLASLTVLCAGFAAWVLDITRVLCSPRSWLQGHAFWHLAGALAAWLLYRHLQAVRLARGAA